MSKNNLPKEMYIHIEEQGTKNECYICNDTIEGAANLDKKRIVGIYKLIKVVELKTEVVTKEL